MSPARIEDFHLSTLVTEVDCQKMLRHVDSRWLSMRPVLTRIVEQWNNLEQYFLKFLPKEKKSGKDSKLSTLYSNQNCTSKPHTL